MWCLCSLHQLFLETTEDTKRFIFFCLDDFLVFHPKQQRSQTCNVLFFSSSVKTYFTLLSDSRQLYCSLQTFGILFFAWTHFDCIWQLSVNTGPKMSVQSLHCESSYLTCCDRVQVRCVSLLTKRQSILCANRGDCTLHHEYSFRPTTASLHPGTSYSALPLGSLIHIHICLYLLYMVLIYP